MSASETLQQCKDFAMKLHEFLHKTSSKLEGQSGDESQEAEKAATVQHLEYASHIVSMLDDLQVQADGTLRQSMEDPFPRKPSTNGLSDMACIPLVPDADGEETPPVHPIVSPGSSRSQRKKSVGIVLAEEQRAVGNKSPTDEQGVEWVKRTFSSFGSFRRQSTVKADDGMGVIETCLSFRAGAGMPALDLLGEPAGIRTTFSRKTNRHEEVFHDPSELLAATQTPRIDTIDSDEFDLVAAYDTYQHDTFVVVCLNVLCRYRLFSSLHFDIAKLKTFVQTVYAHYRNDNPFSNALHAADVVQTTHVYLCQENVKENFSDVELLGTLFASMCIDVGHLGVSNEFLVKTHHPVAQVFGCVTPQESMSCALAFALVDRPDCNFFASSVLWKDVGDLAFRELVEQIIISTAATHHQHICEEVGDLVQKVAVVNDDVPKLLRAIVHAADISYATKQPRLYAFWIDRVMAEYWRQGDSEKAKGMEVSPMCDRENLTSISKSQVGYVRYVVQPYFNMLKPVLPAAWTARLEENSLYAEELDANERQTVIQRRFAPGPWKDIDANDSRNPMTIIMRTVVVSGTHEATNIVVGHMTAMSRVLLQHVGACRGGTFQRFAVDWVHLLLDLQSSGHSVAVNYLPGQPPDEKVLRSNDKACVDYIASVVDTQSAHPVDSMVFSPRSRNSSTLSPHALVTTLTKMVHCAFHNTESFRPSPGGQGSLGSSVSEYQRARSSDLRRLTVRLQSSSSGTQNPTK